MKTARYYRENSEVKLLLGRFILGVMGRGWVVLSIIMIMRNRPSRVITFTSWNTIQCNWSGLGVVWGMLLRGLGGGKTD